MKLSLLAVCGMFIASVATASSVSIGPGGINAAILQGPLTLDGTGIFIGQMETGRPGKNPPDTAAEVHPNVTPAAVYRFTSTPDPTDAQGLIGEHAQQTAGVLISNHPTSLRGVAPGATLHASAVPGGLESDHLRTLNFIAGRNNRDVRAINLSYGLSLGSDSPDGNSYFTRGFDWLATAYDNSLFVVAGNQGEGGAPLPKDNYNGLVVGSSAPTAGTFNKVSTTNFYGDNPTQARTEIGLIAPGEGYLTTMPGGGSTSDAEGTSIAAPHVTGTVALIQQLGERNLVNVGGPHWQNENFREHEVSKAVLINSADKIAGVHGSTRTIVSADGTGNYDWEGSTAYTDDAQPLDIQFGAGHLNAAKAATQFSAGEWDGGENIPNIGWDFGETGGVGDYRYTFEDDLTADSWIALTLTWDREVNKTGDDDTYSVGDLFSIDVPDNGLCNLDLYLVPSGSNDFEGAMSLRSIAAEQNVEHIFAKVPATGAYDIVVR